MSRRRSASARVAFNDILLLLRLISSVRRRRLELTIGIAIPSIHDTVHDRTIARDTLRAKTNTNRNTYTTASYPRSSFIPATRTHTDAPSFMMTIKRAGGARLIVARQIDEPAIFLPRHLQLLPHAFKDLRFRFLFFRGFPLSILLFFQRIELSLRV